MGATTIIQYSSTFKTSNIDIGVLDSPFSSFDNLVKEKMAKRGSIPNLASSMVV